MIAALAEVSKSTVRANLRHISVKLDARNRTEAVARGRELAVLAPLSRT